MRESLEKMMRDAWLRVHALERRVRFLEASREAFPEPRFVAKPEGESSAKTSEV